MTTSSSRDAPASSGQSLAGASALRMRLAKVQTIGRLLLLAIVAVGAIGLLGGKGPLSMQSARMEGGELTLPRFVRYQTPFEMVVSIQEPIEGPVRLALSDALARSLTFEDAWPQPVSSRRDEGGLVMEFAPGTTRVSITARPGKVGDLGGRIGLHGEADTPLRLWGHP